MIKADTIRYVATDTNSYEVRHRFYYPDTIIEGLASSISGQQTPISIEELVDPAPEITLPQAKALIVDALTRFSPDLGKKAHDILENRLNMPEGTGQMMRCRQAGVTIDHLKNRGMDIIPDEILQKRFPNNDNSSSQAIVDMDYHGTINSVVYLTHEVGHAIADDYQQEAGNCYLDNPFHMEELQAYFIQSVVRHDLINGSDPVIAQSAKAHRIGEIVNSMDDFKTALKDVNNARLHERSTSLLLADRIVSHLVDRPERIRAYVSKTLLGGFGSRDIAQTLSTMGIETANDYENFLKPQNTDGKDHKSAGSLSLSNKPKPPASP